MTNIKAYKDEDYIRGKAPMTKREIRILTIALLGIEPGDVVVDVGAGTGGLTMEAACAAASGHVYAVEAKEAAIALEKQNIEKFGANNVTIVEGKAPEALSQVPDRVDRIILGGTGGNMQAIVKWCAEHLNTKGRVIANFVTLENAAQAVTLMREHFEQVDVLQVGVSRGEAVGGLTMLKAANPIFIITGEDSKNTPI